MPTDIPATGRFPYSEPAVSKELIARVARHYGFLPNGLADLGNLGLSAEQIEARRGYIGCSDLTIITDGDAKDVEALRRFKRNEGEPADLSRVIHVQLGSWTEPFILAWAARELGVEVTRRGEQITHPRYPWLKASLDGWCTYRGGQWVMQAKHVNEFSGLDSVIAKYAAQTSGEVSCTGADGALLCVMIGTGKMEILELAYDPDHAGRVLEAAAAFWASVHAPVGSAPAPSLGKGMRRSSGAVRAIRQGETDMTGSNIWAEHAANWLAYKEPAERFKSATEGLKAAVPETTSRAFGHGVQVKMAKNGAAKITAMDVLGAESEGDE